MRNCPLCAGSAGNPAFPHQTYWRNKTFHYVSCSQCRTVFVDPIPDDNDFNLMYSKENYHDVHYGTLKIESCKQSIQVASPALANRKILLDYGCGNGAFLIAAKQAGFTCVGVEYTQSAIEKACKNANTPVYHFKTLKEIGRKFDVIHLGDVLDALPEPREVMIELQQMLKPDGVFFIEGQLQANASLVYWASVCFRHLSMLVKRATQIGKEAPVVVQFLTNAKAQKEFFVHRLGYRCLYFKTTETGWPYFQNESHLKHGVALIAIASSKFFPGLANRFLGVFQP